MLSHRFQDYWGLSELETPSRAMAFGTLAAFAPLPCPMIHSMAGVQQSQTEQLYRLAFEQAQLQVALSRRARCLDFSMN
jgi:hypothetical protein